MADDKNLRLKEGIFASALALLKRDRDFKIAAGLGSLLSVAEVVAGRVRGFRGRTSVALGTALFCACLYLLLKVVRAYISAKTRTSYLNPYLEIISYKITYKASPTWTGGTVHYDVKVRAVRPNVTHFRQNHRWSGGGSCTLVVQQGIHEALPCTLEYPNALWETYCMPFDEAPVPFVEKQIKFQIDAPDPENVAGPFLSKTIDDYFAPTAILQLRVILPTDHQVSAKGEIYTNSSAVHGKTIDLKWDGDSGIIEWSTPHKVRGNKYQITWKRGPLLRASRSTQKIMTSKRASRKAKKRRS